LVLFDIVESIGAVFPPIVLSSSLLQAQAIKRKDRKTNLNTTFNKTSLQF